MGLLLLAHLPGPLYVVVCIFSMRSENRCCWVANYHFLKYGISSAFERRIIPPRNRIWGVTRPALVFCVVNPILFILPTTIVFLHIVLQPLVEFGDAQEKMYHWVHWVVCGIFLAYISSPPFFGSRNTSDHDLPLYEYWSSFFNRSACPESLQKYSSRSCIIYEWQHSARIE